MFLGQDLMRQAMNEQSLQVFEEPAGVMHDASRPLLERNDAFTAIRFGLAGLVLRAWEPTIVEPCEAYNFGGGTLDHRFKNTDLFGAHDAKIIDNRRSPQFLPVTDKTQGEYALGRISRGLQQSMGVILAEPDQYATSGIPVRETLQDIRKYVTHGRGLGLTSIADHFNFGEEVIEDFYRANKGGGIDTDGLIEASRNPVRFTAIPVAYVMRACVVSRWQQQDGDYALDVQPTDKYRPEQQEAMIRDIFLHAARASQRNDANQTVLSSENISRHDLSIGVDRHDEPEASWQTKHSLPIRRLKEGHEPPDNALVSNRQRQKCPIGYTEKAGDPMPIRSIYEAIALHLIDAGLHKPVAFMAPKIISESLSMVR